MKDFTGKLVFLVGGSSGIGLSLGKRLSEKGAHIVLFARNRARLEKALETVRQCRRDPGQRFSLECMDVSSREEVETILLMVVERTGPPDVLINCAGRALPRHFEGVTFGQLDEIMKVNMYGPWNTASVLAPFMNRGGLILNVSSVAGLIGVFGYTDYCASKFAVIGFSEALRMELKPKGVTVCVLCPPDTDTPGLEEENRTKPEETKALSKSARIMSPDEVAEACLKGMARGRFLIIPGLAGKLTWLVKRLWPGPAFWLMGRTVARVQGGKR